MLNYLVKIYNYSRRDLKAFKIAVKYFKKNKIDSYNDYLKVAPKVFDLMVKKTKTTRPMGALQEAYRYYSNGCKFCY